jgi:ankyrin repeat protein
MGYTKSAALLIDKGASLEAKGQNDSTPLHFAAREGKTDVVNLLLERGASVHCKDTDGDNPLQCAEINGHTATTVLLRAKLGV